MLKFLGNFEAKIDVKARVFVPAAFRKILQSSAQNAFVLRKDIFQSCLVLYPESVWDEELKKLRSRLSRWDKQEQQLFRQFVVDAERLEIDSSGRILIPKRYLQMVDIDSEVMFLGIGDTIEMWKKGKLDETLLPAEDFSSMLQSLMSNTDKE
jgi:MraZ protein